MRQRVKIPTRWSGARLGFSMSGVGSVSAEQAVWNLPATLSVQQGGNIPLRQYALNSSGWSIVVSNLPAGVTYNSGLERLEGAATGTSSGTATFTLTRVGGSDVVDTATVALVDPDAITPAITVEYVDTSGAKQSVSVVDGVTSITGYAPLLLHLDASGTRASEAYAAQSAITDPAFYAWLKVGSRVDWGDGGTGTWDYPEGLGASRAQDDGPLLYGHVYENAGAHTTRVRVRDELGSERTVSFTVNVQAQPVTRHIPVSDGTWGSLVSGGHYTLDANGNYSGFGPLQCDGLHNVLFSKVGSGADPVIGTFRPDSRMLVGTPVTSRARHIRIWDIDCSQFYASVVGYDFCGVVNGRARTIDAAPQAYYYGIASTSTERNNVRYSEGAFLWNCGEIGAGANGYVFISALAKFHAYGVDFHQDVSSAGSHTLRPSHWKSTYRHSRIRSSVGNGGHIKGQALEVSGQQPSLWTDYNLAVGNSAGTRYSYPFSYVVAHRVQSGAAGASLPIGTFSSQPQNNDAGPVEGHEFVLWEDCVAYASTFQTQNGSNVDAGGRYLALRNFRASLGTGAYATHRTSVNPVKIPSGWDGPYFYETANTRPTPTAF